LRNSLRNILPPGRADERRKTGFHPAAGDRRLASAPAADHDNPFFCVALRFKNDHLPAALCILGAD
jgi:hypothetical protein